MLNSENMAHSIEKRPELLPVNSFARLYGITREEVMRITLRGFIKSLLIPTGNRYYINNSDLLAQAKAEGMKPTEMVHVLCRRSKR